MEMVHVDTTTALKLVLRLGVLCRAGLGKRANPIGFDSRTKKRKTKEIAVDCRHDRRLDVLYVPEESHDRRSLVKPTPVSKRKSSRKDDAPRPSRYTTVPRTLPSTWALGILKV
jgi:hypothetical protein